MRRDNFAVYLLTNIRHTVLYIGVTNNLERRTLEHKLKTVPGFTKKYNLTKLVYYEFFSRIEDAIAREKQLKGLLRSKKEALIAKINPEWRDLSESFLENRDPSLRSG